MITSGIVKDSFAGNFTFYKFYLGRIKRIVPAVMAMILINFVGAYFILLAPDFLKFVSSLVASLAFFANIYFFMTGGYFGGNDELKPLLHMWSLGAEEQFYIFFPVLMYFLFRLSKNLGAINFSLILVSASSYAVNFYLLTIDGNNAAFFLLPARIWQFGAGAIVALLPRKAAMSQNESATLAILGLGLIIYNFWKPSMKLPAATYLTIGTCILLWNSWEALHNVNNVLNKYKIIHIGRLSFSLYLYHWPIMAFIRYLSVSEPSFFLVTLGLGVSILMAFWSWKYIEEPFRIKYSNSLVLAFVASMYVLLTVLVFIVHLAQGFPNRHTAAANLAAKAIDSNFRCPKSDTFLYGGSRACNIGNINNDAYSYAVLGNSHAFMYAPIIAARFNLMNRSGIVIPLNGCLPTTDINTSTRCLNLAKSNFEVLLADEKVRTVVIGTTWDHSHLVNRTESSAKNPDLALAQSLLEHAKALESKGKKVYLIGPIATPNFNFPSTFSRAIEFGEPGGVKQVIDRNIFDQ